MYQGRCLIVLGSRYRRKAYRLIEPSKISSSYRQNLLYVRPDVHTDVHTDVLADALTDVRTDIRVLTEGVLGVRTRANY